MTLISRLRELEARATKGPFEAVVNPQRQDGAFLCYGPPNRHYPGQLPEAVYCGQGPPDDVRYDAALRNSLPRLLSYVEAAEKLVGAWQAGHTRADLLGHLAGEYGRAGSPPDDIGCGMRDDIVEARSAFDAAKKEMETT